MPLKPPEYDSPFQDPQVNFRPKFRYWLPDASVHHDEVAQDISNLSAIGAGGVEFLPFYYYGGVGLQSPTADWDKYGFGKPAFQALFKDALRVAKASNVLMDFAVGVNQGQGVPSEPSTPGLAVQLLVGNAFITSGETFNGPVPPPGHLNKDLASGAYFMLELEQFGTPNLTAVIAVKVFSIILDEPSVVDLTTTVMDGLLTWTPPPGNSTWRIFTFWQHYTNQRSCIATPGAVDYIGNGSWIVDHFCKEGAARVTDFLDRYVISDAETESLLRQVGNYAWEDSMEILASLYWTPDFLDKFEKARGYSLVKYLPLMFGANNSFGQNFPPYSELYLYVEPTDNGLHVQDYRTTLNEGYQEYIAHFRKWSHSKDIQYSNQPAYNLPLQMLSDIPYFDAPEGESLGFSNLIDAYRQFSGPAHLAGIRVISTELGAVFSASYSQKLPDLIWSAKTAFAGGLTMMVIHGSPYSGDYPNTTWPGYTTFYYNYFEMWNIKPIYILQKGTARVDLAFYPYASPWTHSIQYNSTNLQDLGYTYDYLGPDNLYSVNARVQDHVLAADGPAYKALIFSSVTPEYHATNSQPS
ncbi:uncharacterized protein Z518_06477 [Rhinocladiella mackenziei CBS 650.93]|uniref:Uncharacterized protein n=1 Tax=Rhinocladiella mackenziei CBS 650.93 TaxID=1442369 RepID=A0A0D2J913_9EURO|nr:uncharacterized protein Z518_06477 [Rhinocladiella mackenziei CBS 650.93]KIX05605.1 hypothetical protein Z518_06477 [Rhinocladiella mackenziei CBS 650.93]